MKNISIKSLNLLFINYDKSSQENYYSFLKPYINTIRFSNTQTDILTNYSNQKPDIIIIDTDIKNVDAFEIAKIIKDQNPYQMIILISNSKNEELLYQAFECDIDGFILKSEQENLINKLQYLSKKQLLRNKNIQKRETLESILDNQSGLMLLTDFDDISYASKSFLDFFNLQDKSDIFQRYETILDIFIQHDEYLHAKNKDEFLQKFKNAKAINKVVLLLGRDFNPKAFHINVDKVHDKNKDLYIISLSNISILQRKNIETSYKAYVDGLTGVFNRNKFEEVFKYEMDSYNRYKSDFCVAILDIDHFKKFNDTYGHLIGDEVLTLLATTIDQNIRKADTFARWGGEEFVLLMPKTKLKDAAAICEKLRVCVENICHVTAGKITCSFGVTQAIENDKIESIYKRCDKCLYDAKAAGRNRVIIDNLQS